MDWDPTQRLGSTDAELMPAQRPHKLGLGKGTVGAKAKGMTKGSAWTPLLGRVQEFTMMLEWFGVVYIPLHPLGKAQQ